MQLIHLGNQRKSAGLTIKNLQQMKNPINQKSHSVNRMASVVIFILQQKSG